MQHLALLLMLGTAIVAGLGPAVEAAAPCQEECPAGASDGGCSSDFCCSCCIHFRFDPPRLTRAVPEAQIAWRLRIVKAQRVPLPDPREIAHVPKPALS